MIIGIIIHPERWTPDTNEILMKAGVPSGTHVQLCDDVPLQDEEGNPILAFCVRDDGLHCWTGEAIPWKTE